MDGIYGVWCRVSGGVTVANEGWLKTLEKKIWTGTQEEAQAKASKLNKEMNNEHSLADFRYTAKKMYAAAQDERLQMYRNEY